MRLAVLLVVPILSLSVVSFDASAKQPRSHAARTAFVKSYPCPATGLPKLPCKGYIIDHVVPLCAGGEDDPRNMQWQTVKEAKKKDKDERRMCSYNNRQ